jgi:NADH:ubiquinone oxidoreductase subunit
MSRSFQTGCQNCQGRKLTSQWHNGINPPSANRASSPSRGIRYEDLLCFCRWNGQTGTQVWTAPGELVGNDEFGNRYYRTKGGKIDPSLGFERRWVIYNGVAEASTIPPSWHGWMHHMVDVPPTLERVESRPWWKPHRPNLTGTPGAQRPTGSTLAGAGRGPPATTSPGTLVAEPAWPLSRQRASRSLGALSPPHSVC